MLLDHCVKSVQIRSFFWSKYGKIRTRRNSVVGYFSCSGLFNISGFKMAHAVSRKEINKIFIFLLEKQINIKLNRTLFLFVLNKKASFENHNKS